MKRMALRRKKPKLCQGAKQAHAPQVIKPMLATLAEVAFSDPEWLFETKWDGVRAVCFLENGLARFVSRSQNDLTALYPELADIGKSINAAQVILDGEIVALDEHGVSRFQLLQPRLGRKNKAEIERLAASTRLVYYVFDLLYLDGFDLMGCILVNRKHLLETIIKPGKNIRYSDHLMEHGKELYREVAKVPLEGVVAKRLASTYVQRRSRDWLKIKTLQESEVVIGGYTEPRNSRSYFGALVVGLYERGQLCYVGHVGGGFNDRSLEQIYQSLQSLRTEKCPFGETPQTNEAVQWVKAQLIAQVKFVEWTADRRLRQPIFLGLRDDKRPMECIFESAQQSAEIIKKSRRKTWL
jgi:bifunctional non-homologous end joining protein LigD